ncbi:MAG TPA: CCA tRNA nucleotidyltransferase [Xanthobacteraceae bacterium]|nr:CCA tRNA nucleotidyltransferase [Xanthobacteraceae bacterium]
MTDIERGRLAGAQWLTQGPLAKLLAVLHRDGEEARVVGGAVRDALLGKIPQEIDLATTAVPEEVIRRTTAAGFKAVPTGVDHGTVTVIVNGAPYEVTTLREDIETFGRKAVVRFGRDWKLDAERRDLTINALSVSADGTVYDDVGGLADLAAGRVRFIGNPATRIAEDYLRVLRFFRFHAAYANGALDPAGFKASTNALEWIDNLSRERVRMEFLKLLIAKRAASTLAAMAESSLLVQVLGGVPLVADFSRMVEREEHLGLAADPMRRLAALGVFTIEDAQRLGQRLRLSNNEFDRLASMVDRWWRIDPAWGELEMRALLYRLGADRFVDRVLMAWVRSGAGVKDEAWQLLATLPQTWPVPVFPLKAADLMARGVEKGPRLGAALKSAEEAWIKAGFPMADAALADIADVVAKWVLAE